MTYGDYIRGLNDEELAEYLEEIEKTAVGRFCLYHCTNVYSELLAWLESEVESD